MLLSIITEFIGTFLFLSIILATGGAALPVGVALAAVVYFAANVSGAMVNPAISIMMWAKGALSTEKCLAYVIVQIVAGLAALWWFKTTAGAIKK
jgi:aquaporin Z